MLHFELDVVAQHRRELGQIHLVVVGPGRFIAVVVWTRAICVLFVSSVGERIALLALPGPGGGIGAEAGIREVIQLGCSGRHRTAF